MKNPYHPSEEAEYQSWQHGFGSQSLDDNPYEGQDPELEAIWLDGYNSKPKKPGRPPKTKSESLEEPSPTSGIKNGKNATGSILDASTEELEKELFRRKGLELQALVEQEVEVAKVLTEIQSKINRIRLLIGEEVRK